MIFQQNVFSLHTKPSSFLWRWTFWMAGFQAGEDRHGMLGFYLGAGDEEDDFGMQRFRTKILKPTTGVASEMGRRGRREAVEALGCQNKKPNKNHHCWRKPFQCLDQCCKFHVAFRSCVHENLEAPTVVLLDIEGTTTPISFVKERVDAEWKPSTEF